MAAGFEQATSADLGRSGTIYTSAGFDPIALLPAAAGERLRQLRQKARDAHSLMPEFADRYEANTARGDAERRLQRLLASRSEGGFALRENDPQIIEQKKLIQKLADEARRLSELDEVRSVAWQSASRLVQAVETYLRDGRPRGTTLQDIEVESPKLAKGENGLLDAIENRRRRVRELRASLHRIASSPFPSAFCKQRMREQIEALAQQGAPAVSILIEHDRPIAWPTQTLRSDVHNTPQPAVAFAQTYDLLPVIAWLHKDALIKRLDAEIDAESDDKSALTHEARQQQEAEVQGDLLDIERQEASLVWAGQEQGLPCQHRADCSVLAILQCRLETAAAGNGDGTLQHVIDIIGGGRR